MNNSFPDTERQKLQAQAKAAGLPYTTILGQHLYDLQGLEDILTTELAQLKQAHNPASPGASDAKTDEVTRKLTACQAEISAYKAEQQQATHS